MRNGEQRRTADAQRDQTPEQHFSKIKIIKDEVGFLALVVQYKYVSTFLGAPDPLFLY